MKVPRRSRRPAGESRDAFRVPGRSGGLARKLLERVRTRHRFLIERVRIIKNKDGAQIPLLQIVHQALVIRPVVLSRLTFYAGPPEIHPHKFESASLNQIEIPPVAADKVDVHAHAGWQDWRGKFTGFRPKRQSQGG